MYVLHVDHGAALGGAERSMIELARAQRASGHEVAVAVGTSREIGDALRLAGLTTYDLRWPSDVVSAPAAGTAGLLLRRMPGAVRSARRLALLVRHHRPRIVHVHTRKAQLVSSLAPLGVPTRVVWHLRDDVPARRALRLLMRAAIKRVDHAVALSQWMRDRYAEAGLLPRSGRIGLVPSGIDPTGLVDLARPFLDGRQDPVVGFVGQIARWKAPHLLIEAAEHLTDLPGIRFRIVGDVFFSPAEDAYGAWLRERLASSPARPRIGWVGRVPSPTEAFAQIDVLVHTSTAPEPFGRVLVESMMSQRPIVALRQGSPAELLDESCAVFAERADGAAIAAAIRALVSDRERARRLALAAAEQARRYEPAVVAASMDAEYRSG